MLNFIKKVEILFDPSKDAFSSDFEAFGLNWFFFIVNNTLFLLKGT
jgi:hypothetical protein